MIHYVTGNLLAASDEALVNTVNTVGIMGKGIALQFKDTYPNNFQVYQQACKDGTIIPGKLLVTKEATLSSEPKWIINFPTKKDWKHRSKYEYIEEGLKDLVRVISQYRIKSIAIPPLGCGNGGLDWSQEKTLMEKYLGTLEIDVHIYQPNEAVSELLKRETDHKEAKLTPARALLLYALFYYESLGENSSLFVANKLAYFMQLLGEPSFGKLNFAAAHYGPYCPQVGHILHDVNGKYLKGLEQMGIGAFDALELQYSTMKEVSEYVKTKLKPEQIARLKQLIKLITGFQSALSLEVLASVAYVRKENPCIDLKQTITKIQEWSPRKKHLFKEKYIQIAYNYLDAFSQGKDELFRTC